MPRYTPPVPPNLRGFSVNLTSDSKSAAQCSTALVTGELSHGGALIEPTNRCLFSSARMYCDEISAENSEVCAGCHNRLASSQVIDLEALWPLEWFLEPLAGQLHSVTECSWDLVIRWTDVLRGRPL